MNGQVLAIAVLAAVAAWLLVRGLMRSPARLAVRLAPYTDRARPTRHRDRDAPPSSRSAWGPMVTAVAASRRSPGERLDDRAGAAVAPRRLGHDDGGAYRRRQLAYTVVGWRSASRWRYCCG